MRKNILILTLLLFSVFSGTGLRAYPKFVFENVTTQNGLSSHYVRCIVQDKYGLMWFGTDEGLNRYDGSQFDVFRHTRSADSGLNSSWINCIYEDSEGNLWIGTEKGISVFDIENGTLEVLSDELDTGNRFGTQRVFAFHEDNEKAMWIGTSQGIIRYDRKGHKLEHFVLINNPGNTLGNEITSIVEDVRGNLWIGSFDGVWRYSADTKVFEPFYANVNSSQNNYIESIYLHPDDPDHVYLATSKGFTIIDLDGRIINSYDMSNSRICDNDVCCIIKYDDDNLLLGTANGLSLFNITT
jgi:ligand-binding sensor domain-containing protein